MPPSPQPVVDTEEREPSVEPNLEQAMPGLDEGQQGAGHELDEEQLDADHDDAPLRYKKLSELGDQAFHVVSPDEPVTLEEAMVDAS
ncbi:hypothetical protein GUJ93_ZPchr0009g2302 [Zizania palustris]|uniref:Uncharacterized protein n=1 Tax=Zizania palustris TaxID=103762 RepID=A0A8J5VND2_ZIZPA|nr:hypothetical protein GUJ93_ZPchr0009g2302 [Zizania palustris]